MEYDRFEEKLARFKESEKPEVVLVIADDPERTKIVVAWTNIAVTQSDKLTELDSEFEGEVWDWLWRNTCYSRQELITKSTVPAYGFDDKLAALVGNRLLYPDGTINTFVQRYLREKVLKLFDGKPKRATKRGS